MDARIDSIGDAYQSETSSEASDSDVNKGSDTDDSLPRPTFQLDEPAPKSKARPGIAKRTTTRQTTTAPRATVFARSGRAHSATLDATDTLIFTMKSAGHGDKTVAAELRARSLTPYDPKTITTRYRRIREARMRATDDLLRRARRRWSAAEDEALMGAYVEALRRQDEEIGKVRRRLYLTTAFLVAERCPGAFYSAEACERRYRDLMAGEAVTEKAYEEDPEIRRRERVRRLQVSWDMEIERKLKEEWEWEGVLVEELAEQERERRKVARSERGGSVRAVRKARMEAKAKKEGDGKSDRDARGNRVSKGRGGARGGRRAKGRGRGST